MEIYKFGWGMALYVLFTLVIPVLLVVNIPARIMAKPLDTMQAEYWRLAGFSILATLCCLTLSRKIFVRALKSYRSASS